MSKIFDKRYFDSCANCFDRDAVRKADYSKATLHGTELPYERLPFHKQAVVQAVSRDSGAG